MPDFLIYEQDGPLVTLTMNQPEQRNPLTGNTAIPEFLEAIERIHTDRSVRCVILTGSGRAFCAGLDLREAKAGGTSGIANDNSTRTTLDLRNTPPTVLQAMDKPTICAVNGGAAGYGMDTALGCDIRIMGQSAKLAAAFVKRGVVPESGGTWFLPRMIGWAKAACTRRCRMRRRRIWCPWC